MKIVDFFKDVIELLKNGPSVSGSVSSEWFFSEDGKKAYDEAKTLSQKTMFFFDYLSALDRSRGESGDEKIETMLAYILASAVDGSSLEFAKYPDILNPEKNPLIPEEGERFYSPFDMLESLHKKYEDKPIKDIDINQVYSMCWGGSAEISDMYRLERLILAFDENHKDNLTSYPQEVFLGDGVRVIDIPIDYQENEFLREAIQMVKDYHEEAESFCHSDEMERILGEDKDLIDMRDYVLSRRGLIK